MQVKCRDPIYGNMIIFVDLFVDLLICLLHF